MAMPLPDAMLPGTWLAAALHHLIGWPGSRAARRVTGTQG